jgi:hypothetical protein
MPGGFIDVCYVSRWPLGRVRGGMADAYHQWVPAPTERNEEVQTGTAIFLPGPPHYQHMHRDPRQHQWVWWVSVAGSVGIYLSLPVLAYQVSGSGLWTALVVAVGCLPHLAGAPMRDAVAGMSDRRRLLAAVDGANAALLASVPVAFSVDALTAPHVLAAALGAQALFVCFDAAGGVRERLSRPLFSGGPLAVLSAPVLGCALLLFTSVRPLLTVDGVSLVVSLLLIRAVVTWSQPPAGEQVPLPGMGVGLRRRLARLWGERRSDQVLVLVCGLHAAAGGAFLGQFVPWLDQSLGIPPIRDVRLGLLLALWAAGAALATVVLPRAAARLAADGLLPPAAADRLVRTGVLPRSAADQLVATGVLGRVADRLGGYRVTLVFLPISALCLAVCAVSPHWTVAAIALLAWGTAYTVVVLDVRVVAGGARMLGYGLGWPLGALVGGLVAEATGPRMGLASGALLGAAAAVVAWLSPLRTARPLRRAAPPPR